ncbi:hypothetical protein BDV12DRAFT_178332 [Aspergillus spectabilis]
MYKPDKSISLCCALILSAFGFALDDTVDSRRSSYTSSFSSSRLCRTLARPRSLLGKSLATTSLASGSTITDTGPHFVR